MTSEKKRERFKIVLIISLISVLTLSALSAPIIEKQAFEEKPINMEFDNSSIVFINEHIEGRVDINDLKRIDDTTRRPVRTFESQDGEERVLEDMILNKYELRGIGGGIAGEKILELTDGSEITVRFNEDNIYVELDDGENKYVEKVELKRKTGLLDFRTEASSRQKDETRRVIQQTIQEDNEGNESEKRDIFLMHDEDHEIILLEAQLTGGETVELEESTISVEEAEENLLEANVSEERLVEEKEELEITKKNFEIPANSTVEIDVEMRYEDNRATYDEEGNSLKLTDTPEIHTYIVGSGGGTTVTDPVEICGDNDEDGGEIFIPDGGGMYDEIYIEDTVTVCDEGASIESYDLIVIEEEGEIIGSGGAEEDAASHIELESDNVDIYGPIEMDGGDGTDGGFGDGGDGGDGGEVHIESREETLGLYDDISAEGGDYGAGGVFGSPGAPGDGGLIELSYREIDEQGELSVSGGEGQDGTGDDGEIIRNYPEFEIVDTDVPDSVPIEEDLVVEADIENTGDYVGSDEVDLVFDGDQEDSEVTGDIITGLSTNVELVYEDVSQGEGEYFTEISTSDDTYSTTVEVLTGFLDVIDISTNSPVTEEDNDILEINATIKNTGDAEESQLIHYYLDGEGRDSDMVDLSAGEEEILQFEDDLSEEPDGEYQVNISSEEDGWDTTTIVKGEQPHFEVSIEDTNDPVDEEDVLEVDVEIENVGGLEDTQNIAFYFDGEEEDSADVTLGEDESTIETFQYTTTEDDTGLQEVMAESDDDSATEDVIIGDPPFFEISIIDRSEDLDPGDLLEVTVEVENTGDVEGTQDVYMLFDDSTVDKEEITVPSGETDTTTLEYPTSGESEGVYTVETLTDDESDSIEVELGGYDLPDGDTEYEYLSLVDSLGYEDDPLNNPTGDDGGWADYTDQSFQVRRGETYQMTLESGATGEGDRESGPFFGGYDEWDHYFSMWADWDRELELEYEYQLGHCIEEATADTGCEATGEFTVPEDATLGETMITTYVRGGVDASYLGDPSSVDFYGEAEGYTTEIVDTVFEVEDFESPSEALEGETIYPNITVENTGNIEGETYVEYYFDYDLVDSETVQVPPGETEKVEFEYTIEEEGDQAYTQTAEVEDDSDERDIFINLLDFVVDITDTNSPVTEDEDYVLEIDAEIENLGTTDGEQDIEFYFDGVLEQTEENFYLEQGGSETITFTEDLSNEPDDDYRINVSSEDDMDSTTIVKGENAYFEVDIIDTNDPVDEGDILEVDAEVENVGGLEDTQDVEFYFEGEQEDATPVTLGEDESTVETFEFDTSGVGTGWRDISVHTNEESDSDEVVVGDPPNYQVEIIDANNPDPGENLEVTAEIENIGDAEGEQTTEMLFEGIPEDEELIVLGGKSSTTQTYIYDTTGEEEGIYTAEVVSDDHSDSIDVQIGGYELAVGNTDFEYLSNIEITHEGETIFTSDTGDDDGYYDGTDDGIAELVPDETYSVTMVSEQYDNVDYSHYFNLYVDWNQNTEFDIPPHDIEDCNTGGDGCIATGDFKVPSNADLGETRMRVFLTRDDYQENPYNDDFFGEAEDYQIEVSQPVNLRINQIYTEEKIVEGELTEVIVEVENTEDMEPDNFDVLLEAEEELMDGTTDQYFSDTKHVSMNEDFINVSFELEMTQGPNILNATADPEDEIDEVDRTENTLEVVEDVSSYNVFYGGAEMTLRLGADSDDFSFWFTDSPDGSIFFLDSDASVEFGSLEAVSDGNLDEVDSSLGIPHHSDSVEEVWSEEDRTECFVVSEEEVCGVPTVYSSDETTDFETGVLFEDDGSGSFDGSQPLVFVTEVVPGGEGLEGFYDYEIRVPAGLATQVGGTDSVQIFHELG